MRTQPVLLAAALASGLLLAACGNEVVSGSAGSPPVLRIGSAGLKAPAAAAAYGDMGGAGMYRVAGVLPTGPSHARAYALPRATGASVRTLAAALGLTASPAHHRYGWVVASSRGTLQVADSGQWAYDTASDQCPEFAVDVDTADGSMSVACSAPGVAVPGTVVGSPQPLPTPGSASGSTPKAAPTPKPPPPPSSAALRATAAPLLAALGLDPASAVATPVSGMVSADPVVAGLRTSGYETDVLVAGGRITGAGGWIYSSTAKAGASYPLISAAAALKALASGPQPAIACPDIAPDSSTPVRCGGTSTITGGRLGLALRWDGGASGTPVLVPAWLLDVRGSDSPLALVAVSPEYLADPVMPTVGTNPGTSATTGPGSVGGNPGSSGGGIASSESPGPP